ncbi:MAG: PTS sugar transporter subunit IIA [Tepidisphaeraceae bacterium]
MRLTDILKPQNIKVPLAATGKREAIKELVDLLGTNTELADPVKVLDAVLEREATRTTGIGNGLAIPHGKSDGLDHLVMAIGRCDKPVDFQAIDGKPVSLIWMLVSPRDKTGQHITVLAKVAKIMASDRFRADLLKAPDAAALFDLVQKQEVNL